MKITWFGHSTFRVETGNSILLIDPFLKGNPTFEASGISWDDAASGTTHIALTHGHDDHIGDAADIAKKYQATLFANYELANFMGSNGVERLEPMGQGGRVGSDDFAVTLTHAQHSSSSNGVYLGTACGLIISPTNGGVLYHMGDTDVFPGMALINELYSPKIGLVPVGDRFTMGAKNAAFACKSYFEFETVVPCHYGTFPIIDSTADKFVSEMQCSSVKVLEVGESLVC
ncbi:MAG: metal-dependent hydrolase [Hyphomicrobiaceae bacterium]